MSRTDLLIGGFTAATAMLIVVGSLEIMPALDHRPLVSDKFEHVLAYAVLVLPAAVVRPGWLLWLVPVGLVLGGLIEAVKLLKGGAELVNDLVAAAIGLVLVSAGSFTLRCLVALLRNDLRLPPDLADRLD
ncbi:hypothetical protein [Salipiger marinus]|uniref:hypothetical protein n=1 Tax=Salipiger marinus TaxID=555512 RepID=UPI00405A091D